MTGLTSEPTPQLSRDSDPQAQAQLLAAEAVMAHLTGRAPLRIQRVTCQEAQYVLAPDLSAMQSNRGLLEDVVMTALARQEAATLLNLSGLNLSGGLPVPERDALTLLGAALTEPDEQAVLTDYLRVLQARTRAMLRRVWAEVQVVAAGLLEHGELDAEAIKHRIACAQGIRGTLLN